MRQLSRLPQGKTVSGGQRIIFDHFAGRCFIALLLFFFILGKYNPEG